MKFFKSIKDNYLLIIFLGLNIVLFAPIVFFKRSFPGLDLLAILYPYSFHYLNNQSLWMSGALSGFSAWASPPSFAGNWLFYFLGIKFLDFIAFYNLLGFFYFILIIIFSYLAARALGFDKLASVVITSVFVWSAGMVGAPGNAPISASLIILPSMIYFLLKFKQSFNWLWPVIGGVVVGLGLFMGHPQFALIAISGGFLFSLFLIFENNFKKPNWKFFLAFLVMFFLAVGLASFQLLGEYNLVKLAHRGEGISFARSQEGAFLPQDLIKFFLPNYNFYTGGSSVFIGILPLVLAIWGILQAKRNKIILFWSGLSALVFLYSIKYSPLAWLFHKLPVLNSLRAPSRFFILGNFALAILAGYGFDSILASGESFKNSKFFGYLKNFVFIFLFVATAINVAGLFKDKFIALAIAYFDKYYYAKTIGLPLNHYHEVIKKLIAVDFFGAFSVLNKDFMISLAFIISTYLIIIFISKFNRASLSLVLIISGFTWAVLNPPLSTVTDNANFFSESTTTAFLKSHNVKNFRVYSFAPVFSDYQLVVSTHPSASQKDENEFYAAMLPVYLNITFGVDSIDGNDESAPKRTSQILNELLSERAAVENRIFDSKLKFADKIKLFESRKNLLSMMNVKYIISAYPLNEKVFPKVFEAKATRFNIPVYIYENSNVLPRFYFAKNAEFIDNNDASIFENILSQKTDFNAKTFIECPLFDDACKNMLGGENDIISIDYGNGWLRTETKTQREQWLVFSESRDPFWQAKINGKTVPIYTANYLYQAVKVPSGNNLIEFIYKPKMKL